MTSMLFLLIGIHLHLLFKESSGGKGAEGIWLSVSPGGMWSLQGITLKKRELTGEV